MKYIGYFTVIIITLITGISKLHAQQDSIKPILQDSLYKVNNDLLNAAFDGDEERLVTAMKHGADVNYRTVDGVTALMYASQNGFIDLVKILLFHHAGVNLKPENGVTALVAAVKSSFPEIAVLLINNGADVNANDRYKRSPLLFACAYQLDTLITLLLNKGAKFNSKSNDSISPLMVAAYIGDSVACKILINKGADVQAKDGNGYTPLFFATENGFTNIARLLISRHANIDQLNDFDYSPMMIATESGQLGTVRYLFDSGADPSLRNYRSENAFKISVLTKQDQLRSFLRWKGRNFDILPMFRKINIGSGISFTSGDLLFSNYAGIEDVRYGLSVYAGFDARYWAKRILLKKTDSLYYQLWERRYGFTLGAEYKSRALLHLSTIDFGWFSGVKEMYTFGNYRGSSEKPDKKFLTIPKIGIYSQYRNFSFKINWEYCDFGLYQVSPGRLNIALDYSFYFKKYVYQYKKIEME